MHLGDDALHSLAARLTEVPGIVGVMLGGSRGRGEGTAESDTDLGLYYRHAIDVDALGALAREIAGPDAEVTAHGGWGPWVDGGAWLRIDGAPVDLLYRDLDRVEECWRRVSAGENAFHMQTGHPLGVPDLAYPGEVALSRVLADPTGELTARHDTYQIYPPALAATLLEGLAEAQFLVGGAAKVARRGDIAYLALLLSRAVLLVAHAICARAGRWVTNEKGLIAVAARQPGAPAGFAEAVGSAIAAVAGAPDEAITRIRHVIEQVRVGTSGR
ncbi:nucleotidyltransferase domain-containing protein [Pseudactinotalea suaedae]|uniref:nucleotidyltransferase domain-containing protein n=1 Tax=Pseudactinotalea suaedae TaxID=1524924 RepID=UPI0019D62434|nr:nucleotidyltransferase domain-containing protein [Pseudactinotalea suaedae]